MTAPIYVPADFFVQGQFLDDDLELLEKVKSGQVDNSTVSKADLECWSDDQMVTEKFAYLFLNLLASASADILAIPPEVLAVLSPDTPRTSGNYARVWKAAQKTLKQHSSKRFIISMLCKERHWFWIVVDCLHCVYYWGETLYGDECHCPNELTWFIYQYSVLRQTVLELDHRPAYTGRHVHCPKQVDVVNCGPLAAACILAFFIRDGVVGISERPITEFTGHDAAFIRRRIVLSFLKKSFSEVRVKTEPNPKRQRLVQELDEKKEDVDVSAPILFDKPLILPPEFVCLPTPAFISAPYYTPTVKLTNCKMKNSQLIHDPLQLIVCCVATLASASAVSTEMLTNWLNFERGWSKEYICAQLASIKFVAGNVAKTSKATRPIRRQKKLNHKYWVLTEYGYRHYIEHTGVCTWGKMRYQQGRKSLKETSAIDNCDSAILPPRRQQQQQQLRLTSSSALESTGETHINLVISAFRSRIQRPLSLQEIVAAVEPESIGVTEAAVQLRQRVTTAMRQAISTGSQTKKKRKERFLHFRVQRPRTGFSRHNSNARTTLYACLIENALYQHQIEENSTELVQWRQMNDESPPDCFLCVGLDAQQQLFGVDEEGKLFTRELLYPGTLFELPKQPNQWLLWNAPSGNDIQVYNAFDAKYGWTSRRIESGEYISVSNLE